MNVLETIGSIIPPPSYLRLPSVGVDISDSSLKYIQFRPDRRSGHQLDLSHWGDIDIPDAALNRGAVVDAKLLSEVLAEVKERTNFSHVRVSLPEEHAYLFETEIQRGLSFKEIRGQLEFRMQDDVPLRPGDAVFDYDIFDAHRDSSKLHVSVTVYAKETVMSYYDACVAAGVTPLSFEVEAQAIARSAIPYGDVNTHLIMDFGHTRTGIGIVYDGVLMYTSTIDIGGANLSRAIQVAIGETSDAELTTIKNTIGLVPQIDDARIREAIMPEMNSIVEEIKRRINYWNTKDTNQTDRQIESVILCGGSVNLKGLPSFLSKALGIGAVRANVWHNTHSKLSVAPPIECRYSYGYATAIGLALGSFE